LRVGAAPPKPPASKGEAACLSALVGKTRRDTTHSRAERDSAQDHSAIPRIRLPERGTLFKRARCASSPTTTHRRLSAADGGVVDAQQQALDHFDAACPSARRSITRNAIRCRSCRRSTANAIRNGARCCAVCSTAWKRRARSRPRLRSARQPARDGDAQLEADALLAQRHAEVSPATAPFLMAALRGLDRPREPRRTRATPYLDAPGCVCGTPPVASVVRVGGQFQGYRHAMRAVRHRVAHAWYA
jgi:FdhE protein